MPRYHFDLTDGTEVLQHAQGVELPGNAAARGEALALARELKDGRVMPGRRWDGWFVEIKDDHGRRVDMVPIDLAPDEPSPLT
ncbi:MAG: DUF6894 family protein [Xanthobacteraceae bacterium]